MKYLITHDGNAHVDDIFSHAVLSEIFPEYVTVRTRDLSATEDKDCIIFDVGMKYDGEIWFDHHQKEKQLRPDQIPYSAFGLIWRRFGLEYIEKLGITDKSKVWDRIDKSFVRLIDIGDNGIICADTDMVTSPFSFSRMFARGTSGSLEDFELASNYASKILSALCLESQARIEEVEIAKEGVFEHNNSILILDKEISNSSSLTELKSWDSILFVIVPRGKEWQLWTISDTIFVPRMKIADIARGLTGTELCEVTGISDLVFCHTGLFLAVGKTKQSVLELAKLSLYCGLQEQKNGL